MSNILLHPAYFAPISHYVYLVKANAIVFENEDNYQKQTYRNRTYIYGANGTLLLNIPILHLGKGNHQKYKDLQIENSFQWQKHHWKSLESAYRSSPFFEFYEDDLRPLFFTKQKFLLDFNYSCFEIVCDCLQLDLNYTKTEEYFRNPEQIDLRHTINAKKPDSHTFDRYAQVFEDKEGFINNLSILDLLFNEGTNASNYLEQQVIT